MQESPHQGNDLNMLDNQSDSLVSKVQSFNEVVYGTLFTDQSLRYLAQEQRIKSIVYIPENMRDLVILSVEIQFRMGVSFKLQRVIENTINFPEFSDSFEAGLCAKYIRNLSNIVFGVKVSRSEIYNVTTKVMRELNAHHLPLELLSINTKSINWAEAFPNDLLLSVHMLCMRETEGGSPKSEALFWDVASANEWEDILRSAIIPEQQRLYLISYGSDDVSRH